MRFEFATATRILFGPGTLNDLPPAVADFGSRFLIVTGSQPERADRLCGLLAESGHAVVRFAVPHEPDLPLIEAGVALARKELCEAVTAIGGGSVIDAGKAIAGLLTNDGPIMDSLEVVGAGRPLIHPAAPFVAIPTTAGTGAEVTRNAVIGVPAHRVKVSLRSPHLLPRLAVVDPELAMGAPPGVTAACGLDALTQLIEPFVCTRANLLTDALCRDALPRAARALPQVYALGDDRAARTEMAYAALAGGLALANAGLGAVHGFAGPLGGELGAAHGAICAALLPHIVRANLAALRSRRPGHPALARYDEIARMLTGRPDGRADDAVAWIETLTKQLKIPGLVALGLTPAAIPDLVENSRRASSMKANPIELTPQELTAVLEAAA